MNDLIIGESAIAAGLGGIIAVLAVNRRLPAINARRRALDGMTELQLRAELTRCTGAIMVCAQKGDRKGLHHAHRAMKPVMRRLRKKKTAHVAA